MSPQKRLALIKTLDECKTEEIAKVLGNEEYSNCCGAPNRAVNVDGPDYKDIGICPDCKEHCEFETEEP